MVKAGQYRERAVIQRLTEGTVDDYGNVYSGWSTVATRWADMRERTGKEMIQGGELSNVGQATLRVRSDITTQAITAADRIVIRGYTWAIKDVVQIDAKNTVLEFRLERGVVS